MLRLTNHLAENYWHLFLLALLLFVAWRVGTRIVGERPLIEHFPRLTAAVDVALLPLASVIAGTLLRIVNRAFGWPEIDALLGSITLLLAYLACAWALARMIEVSLALRSEENLGERVPKLITGLIYGALLFIGLGLFLWRQGYSFAGVWVSTGVAAAVLGLALQKTLGDLFSGIALGLESPFKLGDWLELEGGIVGEVVDLNWRATRLRGWDNATHVVPNSRLAGESFKNLHDEHHLYAPWYFVQIPAEVDPRFATALLLDAAMRCENVLRVPNPVVRLADAASVPYSYMVWVHLKNYPAMFRGREELYREIHRALREAGIEVAPQIHELRTRRATIAAAEPPTVALALKGLDVLDGLTEDELAQITARSEYRNYDSGHELLAEGAVSNAFYVIVGGLVDVAVRLSDGSHKVVETLSPGAHFGIESMFTPEAGFLEYMAKTDVTLIRIDLDCVRQVVGARPGLKEVLAAKVKDRLDVAEAARAQSRRPARRLSLRDIRKGIERRLRTRGHS
jgi:small-conductance mechanosensitive channel/CRP-like cAMP-binding protein